MPDFPDRLDFRDAVDLTSARVAEFILFRARIDVLVVVDSEISYTNGGGFGVGRFVRLLRETTIGCTRFRVDVAVRSGVAFADNGEVPAGQARYVGFRFDSQVAGESVIDRYDEVFLFGFKPDNSAGPDSNITQPAAFPATDAELTQLTQWMNAGGGVFATGDHDYLGASMCHRIPRVGTMRKWTNAQGVPPIGTPARLDTNQPATPGQAAGTETIPIVAEEDSVAQPIQWVPERVVRSGFFVHKRPHEVLCHPQHGPIDVMPDHPHEGCCIEQADIDATATVDFGAGPLAEYPEVGGERELPKVIAYGHVVPDPPYRHAKGDVNPFTIPMISVYDGHRANVGRVVTDSTWHHWFNLNLVGIEAAADQTDWNKISRYFVNVAKWIARPGAYQARCWWEIVASHFEYPGIEEYGLRDRVRVGAALRDSLVFIHGPCTVTEFILETICDRYPLLCGFIEEEVIPRFPRPDPCLSCPPFEVIEVFVLAGFVEGTRPIAERLKEAVERGETKDLRIDVAEVEEAALRGAHDALSDLSERVVRSARAVADAFRDVTGPKAASAT